MTRNFFSFLSFYLFYRETFVAMQKSLLMFVGCNL